MCSAVHLLVLFIKEYTYLFFYLLTYLLIRDVPVNHPVLGICRVSHYPVLPEPGRIIDPSNFIFFQSKILNRIV